MLAESTETAPRHRYPLNRQRGGYNREVEWYLTELSRIMGERSNFGGLVASIERGGSGGNSGTKGVGMVRIEPFENAGNLHATLDDDRSVHGTFARAYACEQTWRRLGIHRQWRLAARYCLTREKLPPGLHGQLGDLSAVAFVVAYQAGPEQVQRLWVGAAKKGALRWAEDAAAKALEIDHAVWDEERAGVNRRKATCKPASSESVYVDFGRGGFR
jgi:hypothetical protein